MKVFKITRFRRLLHILFGKHAFAIKREGFWWCEELKMWDKDPWSSSSLAEHDWTNWRYTRKKREAFKDFEESLSLGIDSKMEQDSLLFKKRIALWDYHTKDQVRNEKTR